MKRYENVKLPPGSATTPNQAGPGELGNLKSQLLGQHAEMYQQGARAADRALAVECALADLEKAVAVSAQLSLGLLGRLEPVLEAAVQIVAAAVSSRVVQ